MISRAGFKAYAALIDSQANEAKARIREFSSRLKWSGSAAERATNRELLAYYAYDVITSYGDNAAQIAADYYDELASLAGWDVSGAILADNQTPESVIGAVNYATRSIWDMQDGKLKPVDAAQIGSEVAAVAGGRVRRMAHETMWRNADRDGAKFARVTTSPHPCAFCLMLASRGFAYTSEKTALWAHNVRRYHDDCSCVAVASFDDEGLEGYQDTADDYYDMWRNATEAVPNDETWDAWKAMSKSEQAKWTRPDHPTWDGYANFRTHTLLSQMRNMYGIEK